MSDFALRATLSLSPEDLRALAEAVAPLIGSADSASPWMTVDETADYLRWPKERIYKLTAAKAIPHRRHGNRVLFNRGELDGWLDDYREGPACAGAQVQRMLASPTKRPRGAVNTRGPAQED